MRLQRDLRELRNSDVIVDHKSAFLYLSLYTLHPNSHLSGIFMKLDISRRTAAIPSLDSLSGLLHLQALL